jgi:hypothetical protein
VPLTPIHFHSHTHDNTWRFASSHHLPHFHRPATSARAFIHTELHSSLSTGGLPALPSPSARINRIYNRLVSLWPRSRFAPLHFDSSPRPRPFFLYWIRGIQIHHRGPRFDDQRPFPQPVYESRLDRQTEGKWSGLPSREAV